MRKFFEIIFILSLILFINIPCHAQEKGNVVYKEFQPFKMVFLPDINLAFFDRDDKILFQESLAIFQDVIKKLNQQDSPDFVIFGGNLTYNENGKFSDLPMFLDAASNLNAPYYAITGDREANLAEDVCKENFIKEFDEYDYETMKQTFWTAEPIKNVLLIGLDTSVKNEKAGYLNLHQLFWLDSILKNNRDKFTIIAMHHPAIITTDLDKKSWQEYTLKKPELFLELINSYPQVKIILSGHHLCNYTAQINEKLFIINPSITVYPNEYKILEVYPDKIEVENKKISFKQIIKKAKTNLINSSYAKEFNSKKPEAVVKYQQGKAFSRKTKYYFNEKKSGLLFLN
ncbi:MAG TPA: metallophosphoesterase [Candidatus Gastranaerophilales bacterium]|nr:metallophosphoesterase [Candidatus Gastranaerophilales bacterium]